MRLRAIFAEIHDLDEPAWTTPVRMQLRFDDESRVRLSGSGDGSSLLADSEPLQPADMDEYGKVVVADITDRLDPTLHNAEIDRIVDIHDIEGRRVGIALVPGNGSPFYIWVADDEFYWGKREALENFEWKPQRVEVPL